MTLNKLRRGLFLSQRTLGDVQAVRRGRVGERVINRVAGRLAHKAMRKVWR